MNTHRESTATGDLPRRNALVSWLQRSRLVISPADHSRHHRDHGQSSCVFTGWLNPLLDGSRFWRGMERLFAAARSA